MALSTARKLIINNHLKTFYLKNNVRAGILSLGLHTSTRSSTAALNWNNYRNESGFNGKFQFSPRNLNGNGVVKLYSSASTSTKENVEETNDATFKVETTTGPAEKREFLAETKMLLDIVAKSLYSESEIFVRELISNASDALEKLRYVSLSEEGSTMKTDRPLEINLSTDKSSRTFTIQDSGIGMTKEEMIENLGTIAKSGSKAFLEKLKATKAANVETNSIIGQFGVGFYSSFMVANNVEVYSKSSLPDSKGYKWTSDGTGTYEIQEAEGVKEGTKIVVHLKPEYRQFADEDTVEAVIKKYSNFVGSLIYLNGKQINTIQAIWMDDPKGVSTEMHEQFYKFIGGNMDKPRFILHFATDVPLSLRCLLYIPETRPMYMDLLTDNDQNPGVSLYSRKVMIKNKATNIIPQWLKFVRGVVDSEDIPLNLSRELLQDGPLIRKLKTMITNRMLRFLHEKSVKQPEEYMKFYNDFGIFLKEGILLEHEQVLKEDLGKLLRFESSIKPPGETVTLAEYMNRMQAAQKDIYYLAAPNRALAESSPYLEALKKKDVEVLFCFQNYDEIVLVQLRQFDRRPLVSVEKEMRQMRDDVDTSSFGPGGLSQSEADSLLSFLQQALKTRAHGVKFTQKLDNHPCVVTVEEMAAARHFLKTQTQQMSPESRTAILQPRFEVNPKHPLIKKMAALKDSNPELAQMLAEQLFANAMVTAGLEDDPRNLVTHLTELLSKAFDKH